MTNQWIPCSERLPEDESYILVSFSNFTMADMSLYHDGEFYPGDEEKSYKEFGLNVIAWMPLPEPYKEGSMK